MELHITGKNFDLTDAIKAYTTEKIEHSIKAAEEEVIDVRVVLEHTRNDHADAYHVSTNFQAGHDHLHCNAEHTDLYAAIDQAKDEIERLLRERKNTYAAKNRKAHSAQRDAKSIFSVESN